MRIEEATSWPVTIHIAGDYHQALAVCRSHCDKIGLCVTIARTVYMYTGGSEGGVRVGLINYPRFPKTPTHITAVAIELAELLRVGLNQDSFSVETPITTYWHSARAADVGEVL